MAYELQTLERALDLLMVLANGGPMRLSDLCTKLEANQTTVLRTLRVLERKGFVRRTPNGAEYALGTRLVELGHATVASIDVPHALRPWTTYLAREFASTVHVGLLRSGMVTIVDKVDAVGSVVHYSSLGTRMPLHATAIGKAVLALVGPDSMEKAGLSTPLAAYTRHSICDIPELREEVEKTRQRGYSLEHEEYQIGFACTGTAFVLDSDIYGVSVSGQLAEEDEMRHRGETLRTLIGEFLERYHGAVVGIADTRDDASRLPLNIV